MQALPATCLTLALASGSLLGGCSQSGADSSRSKTMTVTDHGASVEQQGVKIEIGGGLTYTYTSVVATGQPAQFSSKLEGHDFGMRRGHFFIGPTDFGAAPEGALVTVGSEGVVVNGEHRGSVPASLAEPE